MLEIIVNIFFVMALIIALSFVLALIRFYTEIFYEMLQSIVRRKSEVVGNE